MKPVAVWGYKAVNEAKLDIPEDISVVSFDDTEMARYMTPSLISIRMDVIRTSDGKLYHLLYHTLNKKIN